MTLEEAFGKALREQRTKKGFSQEKLALDSGLDRTFISLLERGLRQPSLATVFQLSEALNLPAASFIQIVTDEYTT